MVGVIERFERSPDDRRKIKAHCSFVEYVARQSRQRFGGAVITTKALS